MAVAGGQLVGDRERAERLASVKQRSRTREVVRYEAPAGVVGEDGVIRSVTPPPLELPLPTSGQTQAEVEDEEALARRGNIPQFHSFELLQKILQILTSSAECPHLNSDSARVLAEAQAELARYLEPRIGGVVIDEEAIHCWTFAGGRINSTIRHALLAMTDDWVIAPDNFCLHIQREGATPEVFQRVRAFLRKPTIWEDDELGSHHDNSCVHVEVINVGLYCDMWNGPMVVPKCHGRFRTDRGHSGCRKTGPPVK